MIKLKPRIKENNKKTPSYKSTHARIGIIHVKYRENNMIFTLTDLRGNTLLIVSGGTLGYKNAQKSTWTTARECAIHLAKKAEEKGYTRFYLNLRGFCTKRQSVLRVFERRRYKIERIFYRTNLPHNGCRGFKKGRK